MSCCSVWMSCTAIQHLCRVLLLGAGKCCRLALWALQGRGAVRSRRICNRSVLPLKPSDALQPLPQLKQFCFIYYSFQFTRFAKFCKLCVFSLCIYFFFFTVWILAKSEYFFKCRVLTGSLTPYFQQLDAVSSLPAGPLCPPSLLEGNQVPLRHAHS